MSKFQPLKKDKPCPVCESNDGRCRQQDDLILCMSLPDGGAVNGWHFLGASKDGTWGKFVPERDRTYTEAERREWRDRQQQRERQRHQAAARRWAAAMPISERDHWYRFLLQELTLNECDRADLRRRGLSDELIEARGYRSIEPGQRLTGHYPANLPGVTDGRVTASGAGYLIPALTVEGKIAGFQIRLRDAEAGRYRWLSSTNNPVNLADGELPITVAYPVNPSPDRAGWLGFSEGILKPQLAADRLGYPVIGASGGNFGGASAQIQAAIAQMRPAKLVLLADAGAVQNANVYSQYRKLAGLVPGLQVLWWQQFDKGADIDEVTPAQLATAELLDWSQFAAIAHQCQPEPQPKQSQRLPLALNNVARLLRRKPRSYGFKPLPTVDDSEVLEVRSHEEGIQRAMQLGARLIVNVSGTGARKSTCLASLTPEAVGSDRLLAVLPDALNPSVAGFREWPLLEGRHLGNVLDQDGKLRRATPETPDYDKASPSNCDKAFAISLMRDRNTYNPAYQLACLNCQHNWRCGKEAGDGYGARYQASLALKQPRIRLNYGRLHGHGEEAGLLAKSMLILDESSSSVVTTATIAVSHQDLKDKYVQIDCSNEPTLKPLKALIDYLLGDGWQMGDRKHGTNQAQLAASLQAMLPVAIDWDALNRLEDDQEELKAFGFKPEGEPLSDKELRRLRKLEGLQTLPLEQYREFQALAAIEKPSKDQRQRLRIYRQHALTPQLEQERDTLRSRHAANKRQYLSASELRTKAAFLPKRWLRDFLLVLTGSNGHIHWGSTGITLTLPHQQHLAAIQKAQRVILSDASELRTKEALSQKYGIPAAEIFIFQVKQPPSGTVEMVQVQGLGKLGKNRGAGLEQCRRALVAKLKELDPTHATFDWKSFKADGVLFRDTVGSNAYKHCQSISTTIPRPSINGLLARYCVEQRTIVDIEDEGFQLYYKRAIAEALKQWRGRLREQLRPGEKLTCYVMGDEDLPIAGDRVIQAADITPDAARKGEKSVRQIAAIAAQLVQEGKTLTQSAVARMTVALGLKNGTGYTQQALSKIWGRVLHCLQLFLVDPYKKSCSHSPPDLEKVSELIPVVEEIAQTNEPIDLDEVIAWLSPAEWAIALEKLSDSARNLLLESWLSFLPARWLEAIAS